MMSKGSSMRSETNSRLQVQVPAKGGGLVQTMCQLEFATFQGLKSHKPEFADELVRSNKKGPLRSLQPITDLTQCPLLLGHQDLLELILQENVWVSESSGKPQMYL